MVPVLARAAIAVGISGIFMETHPNPDNAKSDGPNSMPIDKIKELLKTLQELDGITKRNGFLENKLQNKNRTKGLPD
jgi:2-dehydro-3-deoxyphosphooctonate aldolase (KDO 8-P synthase)